MSTDLDLQRLSMKISETCAGEPVSTAVGAACVFIICQVDLLPDNPVFARQVALKLRTVADLVDPDLKDPT